MRYLYTFITCDDDLWASINISGSEDGAIGADFVRQALDHVYKEMNADMDHAAFRVPFLSSFINGWSPYHLHFLEDIRPSASTSIMQVFEVLAESGLVEIEASDEAVCTEIAKICEYFRASIEKHHLDAYARRLFVESLSACATFTQCTGRDTRLMVSLLGPVADNSEYQ